MAGVGQEQFQRDFKLIIEGIEVSTRLQDGAGDRMTRQFQKAVHVLRVDFDIELTKSRDANKATISIFNLSEDTRNKISKRNGYVSLSAGYQNNLLEIFTGDISKVTHKKDGTEFITEIKAEDGRALMSRARIALMLTFDVTFERAVDEVLSAGGFNRGNVDSAISTLRSRGHKFPTYPEGITLFGKCSDMLERLFRDANLRWSLQSGQVLVLDKRLDSASRVIKISKASGLLGTPEVGDKGKMTVETQLQGRIKPGIDYVLHSRMFDGRYRADKVRHVGSTFGTDWKTVIESSAK